MKQKLIIVSIAILAACSTAKVATGPSQADVDRVASKYPGYTLAELNQGKAIYETNCGSCHGLKNPTSQNEEHWNHIVPEMVAKTNKKAKQEVIKANDQEILLKYLITMSTAPKGK